MSNILRNLGISVLSNIAGNAFGNYASKLYQYGQGIAQAPKTEVKKENIPLSDPGFNPKQMIGIDDGNWSRRDQRNFRKNSGMSKQKFRDWQAEQLGYDKGNVSRSDLRNLKSTVGDNANNMIAQKWVDYVTENNGYTPQPSFLDKELDKLDQNYGIVDNQETTPLWTLPAIEDEVVEEDALPNEQSSAIDQDSNNTPYLYGNIYEGLYGNPYTTNNFYMQGLSQVIPNIRYNPLFIRNTF